MITNELGALLDELGKALDIPNLVPDENNTCMIRLKGNIDIQVEMDKDSQYLLIGTDLGELPLGRYREDLFEAALKTNNQAPPRIGIFGYSKRSDHFILFDRLFTGELNGVKIADFIGLFAVKARIWKEAIEHNEVPAVDEISTSDHVGIFGLRP